MRYPHPTSVIPTVTGFSTEKSGGASSSSSVATARSAAARLALSWRTRPCTVRCRILRAASTAYSTAGTWPAVVGALPAVMVDSVQLLCDPRQKRSVPLPVSLPSLVGGSYLYCNEKTNYRRLTMKRLISIYSLLLIVALAAFTAAGGAELANGGYHI